MKHIKQHWTNVNFEWYINRYSGTDYTGTFSEIRGLIHSIKSLELGKPIPLMCENHTAYKMYGTSAKS